MQSVRPVEEPGRGSGPNESPPAFGRAERRCRLPRREALKCDTRLDYDPDAKLYRKGPSMEARLAFLGHALMENRSGLIVDACLTKVSGHAELMAALARIEPHAD